MTYRPLAALGLVLPALAGTVHTGTLAPGNDCLSSGEYANTYAVELAAG